MSYSNFIRAICRFLGCNDALKEKLSECEAGGNKLERQLREALGDKTLFQKRLNKAQETLKKCILERRELKNQVSELKKKIEELVIPEKDPKEIYWNSRYPKKVIRYRRREYDREYQIDVRNYFQPYDNLLHKIIKSNKLNKGTYDERALKCLSWVHDNIKYVSDKKEFGLPEYWCYPYQTIEHGRGDCDDQHILMANLMLIAGIPYWRIRLNAGYVKAGDAKGGHLYTTYCRETDDQFVVMDSTYWYEDTPVKKRKLHKDIRNYYQIWFSWNQRYSFGEMDTMAGIDNDNIVVVD